MNILVLKGTAHAGMKDICVVTRAAFGVGHLFKKEKKKQMKDEQFHCFAYFWQ